MRTRLRKWGKLRGKPVQSRRLSLVALLRRVTAANRHAAIETGAPAGREV